jgi:DNA-binding beta-propeller fold protein YncE
MYSSGLDFDPGSSGRSAHIVLADTGLDRIDFYSTAAGNGNLVSPGHVGTLGSGTPAVGSTSIQLNTPRDVTVDPATGNLFIADTENNRVVATDATGHFLWATNQIPHPMGVTFDPMNGQVLVAETGVSLIGALDPAAGRVLWTSPASGIVQPRDVARGPDMRLWVDDYGHNEIKAFNVDATGTGNWTPVGHLGNGTGTSNDGLIAPYNVSFSPDGTIAYVSDTGHDRIARWSIAGDPSTWTAVAPYAGPCPQSPDPCLDPPGNLGFFYQLRRVAVIPSTGQIIGDDFWGSGLQIWPADGTVANIVQIEGFAPPAGGFAQAFGVAVAADGTIFGVDRLNQRLENFDGNTGGLIATAANRGNGAVGFSWPEAAAAAPDSSIWIADTQHGALRRWTDNLQTATAPTGAKDTGRAVGQLNLPEGVAVETLATGGYDVWVADTLNNRVQVFDPVTSTWAAYTTAAGRSFHHPRGIATSGSVIYVADSDNNQIVQMSDTGTVLATSTAAMRDPEGVTVDSRDGTVWVANTLARPGQNVLVHLSADLQTVLPDSFGGSCSPCAPSDVTDFYRPHQLVAFGGKLYVADTFDNRIQIYNLP